MLSFRAYAKLATKGSYIALKRGHRCAAIDRNANALKKLDRLIRLAYDDILPDEPLDEPLEIELVFLIPEPAKPRFTVPATGLDFDKLTRAVCDCLQETKRSRGLISNDSRIVDSVIRLRYVENEDEEGVRVTIRPFSGGIVF